VRYECRKVGRCCRRGRSGRGKPARGSESVRVRVRVRKRWKRRRKGICRSLGTKADPKAITAVQKEGTGEASEIWILKPNIFVQGRNYPRDVAEQMDVP
jgi:hypothetical protein